MKSYNVLSEDNGVCIYSQSSEVRGCAASNILCENEKRLWLSSQGLPQELILDLSNCKTRPELCTCFGWYCWHSYKSNPSLVELWASSDLARWAKWGEFKGKSTNGENLFRIQGLNKSFKYLKIVVKETFGSANTYINQVFLYEELSESISKSIESIEESQNKSLSELNNKNFRSFDEEPRAETREWDKFDSFEFKHAPKYELPQLPRVDEVAKIRKEVQTWAADMEGMKDAIESIAEQVARIGGLTSWNSRNLAQEIREEIGKDFMSERGTEKVEPEDRLQEAFRRYVEDWENRVFKKDLQKINELMGGHGRSAEEILAKIDDRLRRKALLVKKKELLKKLSNFKPKIL